VPQNLRVNRRPLRRGGGVGWVRSEKTGQVDALAYSFSILENPGLDFATISSVKIAGRSWVSPRSQTMRDSGKLLVPTITRVGHAQRDKRGL